MEEAKSALARARQVRADDTHANSFLERELEGIRESAEFEREIRAGWLACFNPRRKILYRTLLGELFLIHYFTTTQQHSQEWACSVCSS